MAYQWQFKGAGQNVWQDIAGAEQALLEIAHVELGDTGRYRVVAANRFGTATSPEAQVEVIPSGVVAWGRNAEGQLEVPVGGMTDVVSLAGGYSHNLALKSDGTVVGWGDNRDGQCAVPVGLAGVIEVAAGYRHSLALKADGTVVAWGNNEVGQCDLPAGLEQVVQVSAGWDRSLALKADGTVVQWGLIGNGEHLPASITGYGLS